jgi:hypothetical protein
MLLLPYGPIVASLSPAAPLLDPQLRTLVSASVAHLLIDVERQHGRSYRSTVSGNQGRLRSPP